MFGSLFISGGMIGTVIIGKHVQREKEYRTVIAVLCALSFSFLFTLFIFIKKDFEWVSGIIFVSLGFCLLPLYAVSIDFGAELTYPLSESVSTGILMMFGQIFTIIYTITCTYFLQKDTTKGPNTSITILGVSMFAAIFFFICLEEDLQREQKEILSKSNQQNKDDEANDFNVSP
jgi:MFS transporter, FLVCR family, feline leukemia virus subgroup C receptor-related protein